MANDRYPFDDLEDEKSMDGDSFLRSDRDKYIDPYDRPYYLPRGSGSSDFNRDEDEFNKTTRISRESLMAYSPEQGSLKDKYETDYYRKNYRIYSKERDPEQLKHTVVTVKVKPEQGLDPIERYNRLKYYNDRNNHKAMKRMPSSKSRPKTTKPRRYLERDVVYGQSKKDDEEGPVYRNERKKKRVNYKTLLPSVRKQSENEIDSKRKHNEDNEDKSYGYVKDHHGNTYFKVKVAFSKRSI